MHLKIFIHCTVIKTLAYKIPDNLSCIYWSKISHMKSYGLITNITNWQDELCIVILGAHWVHANIFEQLMDFFFQAQFKINLMIPSQ